ncbi:MAG: inorganic phosphate transporter [Anaerolineales bacterium]|nr:MAG: inorganic phosphate transporter [Anaerolineales bacterium]
MIPSNFSNPLLIALIALALLFDFLNGFHDSSNIVATVITSRSLNPRLTLLLAAVSELCGPFIFGVAVATTIGDELLVENSLTPLVLIAALVSAVIWNLITWYVGIPSSSSHALLGGMLGSAIAQSASVDIIQAQGLIKVVAALLLSPVIGLLVGYLVMRVTLFSLRKSSPKVNAWLRNLQVVTLITLGLSHGTNDAQKTMGIIALGLLLTGQIDHFEIPLWVVGASACAIALGTSFGSWRLIRTLGGKMYRIRPIHGFASQIAGASVILGAALLGGPVSTTQVMSSSILGVGAAERMNKVRWNVLGDMVTAWILTIPLSALLAALIYLGLDRIL